MGLQGQLDPPTLESEGLYICVPLITIVCAGRLPPHARAFRAITQTLSWQLGGSQPDRAPGCSLCGDIGLVICYAWAAQPHPHDAVQPVGLISRPNFSTGTPVDLTFYSVNSGDCYASGAILMNLNNEACEVCACGRTFYLVSAYTNHRRSCKKTKVRLAGVLGKAQENWRQRKKQRTDAQDATRYSTKPSQSSTHDVRIDEQRIHCIKLTFHR